MNDKLIEYICEELGDLDRKAAGGGKLTMSELQYMDLLAHAKKNLLKGEEMMEGGGADGAQSHRMTPIYSYDGDSNGGGYRRGRGRDSRGRYSRDGRGNGGDSYSYSDEIDNMVESIKGIMDDLPANVKRDAQNFIKKLESAM